MNNPNPQPAPLDLQQFQSFTPGPWTYPDRCGARVGGPDRLEICGYYGQERNPETRQANLDLIAAAPALLKECRRQRDEIERLRAALVSLLDCSALNEDDNEDSLPAIEAARAALGDR